jgi:transposase-like protein
MQANLSLKRFLNRSIKIDTLQTHCHSNNAVRFGKFSVIVSMKMMECQRYRCNDCRKIFTDITNTPLYRTHLSHRWLDFVQCMIEESTGDLNCLGTKTNGF